MPTLRKLGGGVMEGACSHGLRSDLHPVGFLAVKGIPALGKTFSFAGRCWNGSLGRWMRTEGASSPPDERIDDGKGMLGELI